MVHPNIIKRSSIFIFSEMEKLYLPAFTTFLNNHPPPLGIYHFSIFFGSNDVTFNTPLTRKRPLPEHFVHTSRLDSRVSKSFTVRNPFPLQRSHNFITSIFNMPSIAFISKIIIIFSTSGLSRFCRDPNITSRCGTNNIQLLIFNKNKS